MNKWSAIILVTLALLMLVSFFNPTDPFNEYSHKSFQEALDTNKIVWVHFSGEGCIACENNKDLLRSMTDELSDIVLFDADITKSTESRNALNYLGYDVVPVLAIFNSTRENSQEIVGELTVSQIIKLLKNP